MIKLTLISFQSLPHAESSKKRQVGSYKQKRMIFNKYYMHEIDRHLQILSSGCSRHMHVPVLKFDCNVSQQQRKTKIFMTSYIPYRGQIWQIIHDLPN